MHWSKCVYAKSNVFAAIGYTHYYTLKLNDDVIEIRVRSDKKVQFTVLSKQWESFSFLQLDGELLMSSENNWGMANNRCLQDRAYHADKIRFIYEDPLDGIEEEDKILIQSKIFEMKLVIH